MSRHLLGVEHSPLEVSMPAGACDCHVHVFGPPGRYPLSAERTFMPSPVTVEDLLSFQRVLGVSRFVVVQASPQGTDNRCLQDTLSALSANGVQARGVAVVDAQAADDTLQALHVSGVRGLRVNLQSFGVADPAVAEARLRAAARLAGRMGWHVQVYTTLEVLAALAGVIGDVGVPVVVDHFGLAHASAGVAQPGFERLLSLVEAGHCYVKLSAPYRIVEHAWGDDGRAIARALIEANLDRMLWGTDWPHTNPPPGAVRMRDTPEPLRPVDDGHQFNMFARWTSWHERQRILVDNPGRLYAFDAI